GCAIADGRRACRKVRHRARPGGQARKDIGMKSGPNQTKMRTLMVRALSFSAVAALTLNPALTPVVSRDYRVAPPVAADGELNARFLSLGIGKSIVVDLPREIKDVLVADPKIANTIVRSSQRAYIIGAAVGQTNIVFFDAAGQQIAAYDIAVKRDLNGARAALKQTLPNADIQIDGLGDGVILTGSAASPVEAQQAGDLAARLAGGSDKVVNSITVRGRDQVMLKVTLAEVQRSIIKQMGIDLSASMNYGTAVVKFNNANPFTANSAALVPTNALTTSFGSTPSVQATLRAMGGAGGTTIPSIKTRRAETTLEIPSGGAMAMAGLIQDQTKQAINGLPGMSQLPILGSLFRSRDFVNNQTELMVLVTPYIVRAVAQ